MKRHLNDTMRDHLTALSATATALIRDGFTVVKVAAGEGLPTIEVAGDRRTEEMVALDRASYYKHETLQGHPRRWGQFADKPNGVRVVFMERPY